MSILNSLLPDLMLKKFLTFVSGCLITSVAAFAQAPDLARLIANITVAAPPVEALDQAAIQLHYFDSVTPTPEQEKQMLVAYKALSAGFAANVHYKQGYNVFQKYLNLKEKILAGEKADVIAKLQNEYKEKDKADEDKVVSLQNEVAQLNLDSEGYISKRSGFKNIFSIVIVALSMMFAASLFRSGVRIRSLSAETKANHDKLAENHRIASLGDIAKGIPEQQAQAMADEIMLDKTHAHEVLVKEELGINAEELKGSAIEAAIYSFILFSIGAIIPVLPFMFLTETKAIIVSIISSAIGLFLIGSAITLFTGKNVWYSGFRQVLFGLAAAAVTFGIGKLIGVSIAG